jgi:Leucine-rich repeat (LRR) protein
MVNTDSLHARLACFTEEVAESLEQLWISYNLIEKMTGIEALTNIKVLYMSNNLVSKWPEIQVSSSHEHGQSVA